MRTSRGGGGEAFLDCEFTQLNQDTKLISLALVSEVGNEFYVELTDTYQVEDCSDFVIQHVLPQLDLPLYGMSLAEAQASLKVFLGSIEDQLEVCSDAPDGSISFFVFGLVRACRQAGRCFTSSVW